MKQRVYSEYLKSFPTHQPTHQITVNLDNVRSLESAEVSMRYFFEKMFKILMKRSHHNLLKKHNQKLPYFGMIESKSHYHFHTFFQLPDYVSEDRLDAYLSDAVSRNRDIVGPYSVMLDSLSDMSPHHIKNSQSYIFKDVKSDRAAFVM